MADKSLPIVGMVVLCACVLTACGQTGDLYLPDPPSEVVTREAATPPPENTQAPNSPQTPDSPPGPASPAPEVTEPEEKKDKGAASPPK